jgi:hypothetical protein
MTDAKFKDIMTRLKCKTEEDLITKLLEANSELLEAIYDLQWFMEERDLTAEDFHKWQQEKELRVYH